MNNETEARPFAGTSAGSRLFLAGFLIVAGTLLFLSNLGILPLRDIWSYWPLIVIGLGVSRIVSGPDIIVRLFGGLITFLGALFLLVNLDIIHIRRHDGTWPISVLLIAFGIAMLIKVLDKRDPSPSPWAARFRRNIINSGPNQLSDLSVMGSIKRRVDSLDFRGGNSLCILGSVELDLRHAKVSDPSQTVYLEISVILGATKIRVPEQWRVQIHGASILGNYEDKTIPPNSVVEGPTLVITGYAFMSAVEIED